MSFGADRPASVRHGAKFVHRILQSKEDIQYGSEN